MAHLLARRLVKLEAQHRAGWKAWQGVPLHDWPDTALVAFLCHITGRPVPATPDDMPDTEVFACLDR